MENFINMSLFPLLGIVISALLSIIINKLQNKTKLIKIHSEFIGQLYCKRINAYLEIFNLISGYIKVLKRKEFKYEELIEFYENYSKLDSKSGLLFSYTAFHSDKLMKKIDEMINYLKKQPISDSQKADLIEKLWYVETTMKLELGVYVYKDPATIIKNYEIPERKKEMINKIIQDYLKGELNVDDSNKVKSVFCFLKKGYKHGKSR